MREILSAEQPCILCGQALLIVSIFSDGKNEKATREWVQHDDDACLSFLKLRDEEWPMRSDLAF